MNKVIEPLTRPQTVGDSSEEAGPTTRLIDQSSTLAEGNNAALDLHGRIENWVKEGDAGGEDNESTTPTGGGG